MSLAVLAELLEPVSAPVVELAPAPPLSFREIGYGYRTGRSLGLSFLLHQLALLLIVLSSRFASVRSVEAVPPRLETAQPLATALYLPTLGGGSEGLGKRGGGSGSESDLSSGHRARGRRGFAYPGPQPVVSDPPRAVLGIQTILQPSLKNPLRLRQYLPLPNIEQPAEMAMPEPPKPVRRVLGGELALRRSLDKPIRAPKMTLPVDAASQAPALDASQPIVPRLLPAKLPVAGPAQISDMPVQRRAQGGLLVLNAVPPAPDLPKHVPAAEARSLFAVTPEDATIIAAPGAGSQGGGLPSMATGTGTPKDVASGDALAEAAAGGKSKNEGGSGTGSGGRYGNAQGEGLNRSGEGTGAGSGTKAGAGTGSGAGTALGSGKGAGSAVGTGGFPGIAIRGGRYGNGDDGNIHASLTPPRPMSYGMTITSTANSGGGLPDYGVFQNEKVYTVYLDMRVNDEDPTPSWTLQYSVLQPAGAALTDRIRGTPTPPYAMLKAVPELAPELASKCAHRLIVASAILNVRGQLEQLTVKQSPDQQVMDRMIEALQNWTFQPSQIDGKPVALKILLGIRLLR